MQNHRFGNAGKQAVAVAFPILAVLIWAGNTIVTKLAATAVGPATISFYRWLIAAVAMTPFLLRPVWKNRQVVKRYLWKLAILALLGMVAYQGFAYIAGKSTSATNMGIIIAMMPLASALLSSALADETLTVGVLVGSPLSIIGLIVLIGHGHPADLLQGGVRPGDAVMLAATISYAAYGVLLRRWAVPLSTWQSLYMQVGFAVMFLLPWYLLSPSSPITSANLPLVLYAALPASILAPFLWMTGVRLIGPSRATLFMNLLPVFVALLALLLLGEPLHYYHLAGGVMALAGVWLGQAIKRPPYRGASQKRESYARDC